MKHSDALAITQSLLDKLRPHVLRAEIAGSLRRGKPEVHDAEIVCIPITGVFTLRDMFDQPIKDITTNALEVYLSQSLASGVWDWELDPIVPRNGPKYKRLRYSPSPSKGEGRGYGEGLCVDLFITTPRAWGCIYAIRTGPHDFSKMLVTRAQRMGWFVEGGLLHQHLRTYKTNPKTGEDEPQPCPSGDACPLVANTPEEIDFFAKLGLPFIEPDRRVITPSPLKGEGRGEGMVGAGG